MKFARNSAKDISKEVDFRKSIEYIREAKQIITQEFNLIKKRLISDFENHPVTREIEGGTSSSNLSGTLGGKGNLFSFIGFKYSDKPIEPIRGLLENIEITSILTRRDGMATTHVMYPTADDIFRVTPLPWAEGRSWAKGIENGISNFGQYLDLKSEASRSGRGLQNEKQESGLTFSTTPYISQLIKEFEKDIVDLNRKKIV